jgi:hypothetical protein
VPIIAVAGAVIRYPQVEVHRESNSSVPTSRVGDGDCHGCPRSDACVFTFRKTFGPSFSVQYVANFTLTRMGGFLAHSTDDQLTSTSQLARVQMHCCMTYSVLRAPGTNPELHVFIWSVNDSNSSPRSTTEETKSAPKSCLPEPRCPNHSSIIFCQSAVSKRHIINVPSHACETLKTCAGVAPLRLACTINPA